MRVTSISFVSAVLAGVLLAAGAGVGRADTVLITNVNGYTIDGGRGLRGLRELRQFVALLIRDDVVERRFGDGEVLPDDADRVIDGDGATLLPGLIDAHGHVLGYGLSRLRVDLIGTGSEREAVERVVAFAEANPDVAWIQGRGWNQVLWDSNSFPTAASLDATGIDRPIWLSRVDGHAGWANSAALELAGIDADTVDPDGGQVIRHEPRGFWRRDTAAGNPTGVLVDNAMDLLEAHIPDLTHDEIKLALIASMEGLAAQGLTSVHDAGAGSAVIRAYRELAEEGPLPVRVNVMVAATDPDYERHLAAGHFLSDDATLAINSVKISADGALGSRGAALVDDYSDMPGHRGLLLHPPERLEYFMRAAMNAGFQVATHAIGDDANRLVLDHYQRLISETDTRALRHRIEHAQVLRYEDIARFAELGVIPSMQATHATSDKNMAEDRLGPVRIQGAYAWRKLLEADAVIANGSDFPVESPNPFFGLHASVTRQSHDDEPAGGWFPEERMSLAEALISFTLDAAYAGHQEHLLGSLEPGKKADFILIDRDIFTIPPSEIWRTQVQQTWVNGQRVYP